MRGMDRAEVDRAPLLLPSIFRLFTQLNSPSLNMLSQERYTFNEGKTSKTSFISYLDGLMCKDMVSAAMGFQGHHCQKRAERMAGPR